MLGRMKDWCSSRRQWEGEQPRHERDCDSCKAVLVNSFGNGGGKRRRRFPSYGRWRQTEQGRREGPETETEENQQVGDDGRQTGSRASTVLDARQDLKTNRHSTHRESLPPRGFWQMHDSLLLQADWQMPIGWVHRNQGQAGDMDETDGRGVVVWWCGGRGAKVKSWQAKRVPGQKAGKLTAFSRHPRDSAQTEANGPHC